MMSRNTTIVPPDSRVDANIKDTKQLVDEVVYDHLAPLHPDVVWHITPIFKDLSNDDLLKRCLDGHTQNSNESFNSTVWRLAPKHLNADLKMVEIASFMAACIFNEGYSAILNMMNYLNIIIGPQTRNFAEMYDNARLERQWRKSYSITKET